MPPSDTIIIAKVLSNNPSIEIRKIVGDMNTKVTNNPSIVNRGVREIEKLEINSTSMSAKESHTIKKIETENDIIKMLNYGPVGAKGDKGDTGNQGPAGTLDNFEIASDLRNIFINRLKRNR